MSIHTLVLSGGGSKIYATLGALESLQEKGLLNNINKYAGASAGAIIITLLSMGFTLEEIDEHIGKTVSKKVIYDSCLSIPYNLLKNWGVFSGTKLINVLLDLFKMKGYNSKTTFIELYDKTNKIIVITGTSLSTHDTFYFNAWTTPYMPVIDALRISFSIPIFFTPVKYTINNEKHIFVDGGILNNFPLYYFDITDETGSYFLNQSDISNYKKTVIGAFNLQDSFVSGVLGIIILGKGYDDKNFSDIYTGYDNIKNISGYISSIVNTMMDKIYEYNFNTNNKNNLTDSVISIIINEDSSMIELDIPPEKINSLKEYGKKAVDDFYYL